MLISCLKFQNKNIRFFIVQISVHHYKDRSDAIFSWYSVVKTKHTQINFLNWKIVSNSILHFATEYMFALRLSEFRTRNF